MEPAETYALIGDAVRQVHTDFARHMTAFTEALNESTFRQADGHFLSTLPNMTLLMAYEAVRNELGLHLPELRDGRRDEIAECIVKRMIRDCGPEHRREFASR